MKIPTLRNKLRAFINESVKRLPYVLLLLVILTVFQLVRLSTQTNQGVRIAQGNSLDSKNLLKKVASLSENNKTLIIQNKNLTEQNIEIANENARHLDCLAKLFAAYTQDLRPISLVDLDGCKVLSQAPSETGATSTSDGARPSTLNQPVSSPSPQGTASTATTQPDNPQPTTPNCTIDILFVHVGRCK
jgi:hypothetical protein